MSINHFMKEQAEAESFTQIHPSTDPRTTQPEVEMTRLENETVDEIKRLLSDGDEYSDIWAESLPTSSSSNASVVEISFMSFPFKSTG